MRHQHRRCASQITIGGLAAALALSLTGPAAADETEEPAPQPLTATVASTQVTVGDKVTITATLADPQAGVRVQLQHKTKKEWTKIAVGKTTETGQAELVYTATKPGVGTYRVLAPKTKKNDKAISNRLRIETYRWRYLADMEWHEDGDWDVDAITIAGKRYAQSIYADNIFWGDLEINTNGKCTKLTGVAGLTDESETGSTGALSIFQDGAEAYYSELTMTATQTLDLDITGALRLGFRNYNISENRNQFPVVGIGNAQAYCRS